MAWSMGCGFKDPSDPGGGARPAMHLGLPEPDGFASELCLSHGPSSRSRRPIDVRSSSEAGSRELRDALGAGAADLAGPVRRPTRRVPRGARSPSSGGGFLRVLRRRPSRVRAVDGRHLVGPQTLSVPAQARRSSADPARQPGPLARPPSGGLPSSNAVHQPIQSPSGSVRTTTGWSREETFV